MTNGVKRPLAGGSRGAENEDFSVRTTLPQPTHQLRQIAAGKGVDEIPAGVADRFVNDGEERLMGWRDMMVEGGVQPSEYVE